MFHFFLLFIFISLPLPLRVTFTELSGNPDEINLLFIQNSGFRFEIKNLNITAEIEEKE